MNEKIEKSKKPFDKKKWREQKYSRKYQIQQLEEKRKKAALRSYYKELKKNGNVEHSNERLQNSNNEDTRPKKLSAYKRAEQEFQRQQEEKRRLKEEAIQKKSEMRKALEKYKQKRMQNYKILSRKTRKGQPIMKGRIELLLEKIQNSS